MNTPPLLIAAACTLWVVQTGHWLVAVAAAIALESARLFPLRWNVTQAHFNHLSDFCSVLIVAVAAYLYFTFGNPRALLLLVQWLPVTLLPLALAQAWGNLPKVGAAAFVWTMRKDPAAGRYAVNLAYPYFVVWLLAASATNSRGPVFYAAFVAIAVCALWAVRPKRSAPVLWVALVALAAGGGYASHQGLARLQGWIEDAVPGWLSASGTRTDPYENRTDLGHIGELKWDDAIVLRVQLEGRLKTPLLLHRASYNAYFGTTWVARNAQLTYRQPAAAERWTLARAVSSPVRVTVFDHAPRGSPVLSLPSGTVEVALAAPAIKRNGLGTVQAEIPPGYFSYVALVDPAAAADGKPDEEDLRVPKIEEALLARLAQDLNLTGRSPERAVAEVRQFFVRGFGYSTYQPHRDGGATALADFLFKTRAGHCEYFATATVLLLRMAGVPARYATGFAALEYSRLENAYVVRARHAHAWAKAYVNGSWIDIDTTPSIWASAEAQDASWWSPLADFWSWFRFNLFRLTGGGRDEGTVAALWTGIGLVLAAWLGWRLYRRHRPLVIGSGRQSKERTEPAVTGSDSEFFLVERALAGSGYPRAPGESVLEWLTRISSRLPAGVERAELTELVALHYRYRFDPAGLAPAERDLLRSAARTWLSRHAAQ